MIENLLDFTKDEICNLIKPTFRGKQIYQWIYQKYANSFEEMTNLPKSLREDLPNRFYIDPLKIIKEEKMQKI